MPKVETRRPLSVTDVQRLNVLFNQVSPDSNKLVKLAESRLPLPEIWSFLKPETVMQRYFEYVMAIRDLNVKAIRYMKNCNLCGYMYLPEWNHLRSISRNHRSRRCRTCASASVAKSRLKKRLSNKLGPAKGPVTLGHAVSKVPAWATAALSTPAARLRTLVDASLLNERAVRKSSRRPSAPEEH